MYQFWPFKKGLKLNILCIGSHSDDIEIGCSGTILRLLKEMPELQINWIVLSGDKKRKEEAQRSVETILPSDKVKIVEIHDFRESYFPYIGANIKDYFEKLKKVVSPDIIFTHYHNDAHQDHRLISELSWNTFRDNFILEYEIPKYDGDLGAPNLYVHLDDSIVQKKIDNILEMFKSQTGKRWFTEDAFKSILRIRGIESNSPSKFAEAFYCRKIVFKIN